MKSDFAKRAATSAIFVVVLIGGCLWHPISFFVLFASVVVIGQLEFYKIALKGGLQPQIITGIVLGASIFIGNFLIAAKIADVRVLAACLPIVVVLIIIELFRNRENPFSNMAFAIFGASYVAIPFGMISYFVYSNAFGNQFNSSILIGFFFLIWASDTGAYIIGSWIGKHRLFERISPKKSWEGFFGGMLFSLLAAIIISLIVEEIAMIHWIAISVITVVFGTFGDLLESLLKRNVNIKDSGTILPGHGGILDRFDSLLLAAPIVFLYLMFFV